MRSIEALYLLFAVAHPVSELIKRTNLRIFLNKDYYPTNREDFPVNKVAGIGGSLLVLAVLIAPVLASLFLDADSDSVKILWYLAFGLVLADVIQHATYFVARPRELAPLVHLVTILGVLVPLLLIVKPGGDVLQTYHLLALLVGAFLIFGNWANNSRLAGVAAGPASPSV
jgi:hypothetical protein